MTRKNNDDNTIHDPNYYFHFLKPSSRARTEYMKDIIIAVIIVIIILVVGISLIKYLPKFSCMPCETDACECSNTHSRRQARQKKTFLAII